MARIPRSQFRDYRVFHVTAKGAGGTNVFLESYRYDSRYVAARRKNWTPDCYPRCQDSERIVMVP